MSENVPAFYNGWSMQCQNRIPTNYILKSVFAKVLGSKYMEHRFLSLSFLLVSVSVTIRSLI